MLFLALLITQLVPQKVVSHRGKMSKCVKYYIYQIFNKV